MRIALKITLAITTWALAVLMFTARAQIADELLIADDDARHELETLGYGLRPALHDAWRIGGERRLLQVIAEIAASERSIGLRWVRSDTEPPDARAPEAATPAAIASIAGAEPMMVAIPEDDLGPGVLYLYVPLDLADVPASALELRRSLGDRVELIARTERQVATTAATIAAVSAVLAVLLGWTLVGRRVARLVALARAVGRGERPLPLGANARDELGDLTRELNAMAASIAAAADRSDQETAERERLRDELRHGDRLATIGALMAQLAHEIGTPLNVISARAKLIARGQVEGEVSKDNARIAAEEADRIAAVVREFLDFARKVREPRRIFALDEVIRRVTQLLAADARQRDVELHAELTPIEMDGNALAVQQAVVNLTVNALQAAPAGSRVELEIDATDAAPPEGKGRGQGRYARIRVSDRGPEIIASVRDRLFEPFFTTKPVGGGTGLGLAITARIVDEHGGWIDVEPRAGGGTTFRAYLSLESP